MPRRPRDASAKPLLRALNALVEALSRDDVVLMGRWSRVLAQVHAQVHTQVHPAPPAQRACGA